MLDLPDLTRRPAAPAKRPPTEPTFSADDLADAAAAAAAVAVQLAPRKWRRELEDRAATASAMIAAQLNRAMAQRERGVERLAASIAELGLGAFRGLARPYLAMFGSEHVADAVRAMLSRVDPGVDVKVRCATADGPAVRHALQSLAAAPERLRIDLSDDALLEPGRLEIRWIDGWADLDLPALTGRLEAELHERASALLRDQGADATSDHAMGAPE